VTYQKEKKSLTSFSLVEELMFLTWTVLADISIGFVYSEVAEFAEFVL
jgi:hypothetical protein